MQISTFVIGLETNTHFVSVMRHKRYLCLKSVFTAYKTKAAFRSNATATFNLYFDIITHVIIRSKSYGKYASTSDTKMHI